MAKPLPQKMTGDVIARKLIEIGASKILFDNFIQFDECLTKLCVKYF